MSRARKGAGVGETATARQKRPPAAAASEKLLTTDDVTGFDPRDGEIAQLRGDLNAARIDLADAQRLLFQVKEQRNAHADEIMLLRAQLKVAVEDGDAGWAAAGALRGQPQ